MPQTVVWHYPAFPFQYLLLDRWPSIDRASQVQSPITVFHGTADEMIPIAHGRSLTTAARDATFVEIPEGVHNEIPMMQLRSELGRLGTQLSSDKSEVHD